MGEKEWSQGKNQRNKEIIPFSGLVVGTELCEVSLKSNHILHSDRKDRSHLQCVTTKDEFINLFFGESHIGVSKRKLHHGDLKNRQDFMTLLVFLFVKQFFESFEFFDELREARHDVCCVCVIGGGGRREEGKENGCWGDPSMDVNLRRSEFESNPPSERYP